MSGLTVFVRQRAEDAQAKVNQFEEESRKAFRTILDRSRQQREETSKRVDEFFSNLRSKEAVERLRSADLKQQVAEVREDVLDLFGIASREELARLEDEVRTLRAEVAKLRKGKKATTRKATTKKATTKKAAPKKAAPKKAAPKKATAKKANGKSAKAKAVKAEAN